MKYYDRKNTPLKWNWVLKITLPLLLLSSLFHIISVFQQLFGLKNGNINDFLASAGYSMKNMGPLFWPVIFHTLMSCVSAVIVFYACVGLWKWKSYGPKAVILRFIVAFFESLIVMIYMMKHPSYILFSIGASDVFVQNLAYNITIATFVGIVIYSFIQAALNFVYYRKRMPLFDLYYVQPQSDTTYAAPQTIEPASQMEDTQVLPAESTNAQFEPYYCTECGEKITDPNITFCPNCGKKLN